jgi:hypothetical protein
MVIVALNSIGHGNEITTSLSRGIIGRYHIIEVIQSKDGAILITINQFRELIPRRKSAYMIANMVENVACNLSTIDLQIMYKYSAQLKSVISD